MPLARPSVLGPLARRRWAVAMLLAGAAILPGPAFAQGKLTNRALIGDSVSEPESSKYGDVSDAITRFNNRDIASARLLLEKARRKHPKLPPVAVMMAKMHGLSGNGSAVRPALERSIVEDADDPEPYLLLAEDALNGNRTIEADALFDKAAELIDSFDSNPKRKRSFIIRAYRGRALVDQRRRKWEQAEADLRVWLKQDPENASAYGQLGGVLIMLERDDDALRAFGEAKKLNAKLPSPYVTAGAMLQRRGDSAEALEYFRRAYREDDKNETNATQYARSLVANDNLDEAKRVLQDSIKESPDSFNLWLLSGVVSRMTGDNSRAESFFQKSLAIQPTNRDAMLQITYVLSESKDEDALRRAQQYAALNVKLNEQNADAQLALAWALEQAGRPRDATAALNKGLQLGTPSSDGQLLLAKMLVARDRAAPAKQVLTNALNQTQGIFVSRKEAEELLAELP